MDQQGALNAKWKGGVCVNGDGYLQIRAGPCRGEYVHILVAEAMLGREIDPMTEEVHHIDGDKRNPRHSNLEVRPVDSHRAFLSAQPWIKKMRTAGRQGKR